MINIYRSEITNDLYHNKTNLDFIRGIQKHYDIVNKGNYSNENREHLYINTLVIYRYNCIFSDLNLDLDLFKYIKVMIIGNRFEYVDKTIGFNEDIINNNYLDMFTDYSDSFNQALTKLPRNLTYLIISGTSFNQPLYGLPETLEVIKLPCSYNNSLGYLPCGLKYLSVDNITNDYDFSNIPKNLIALQIINLRQSNINLTNIPIRYIFLNQTLKCKHSPIQLPENLEFLEISTYFENQEDI